MVKLILLIVFCVLAIASYVICKKTKDTPLLSLCISGVTFLLMIAVIICGILITNENEKEKSEPLVDFTQQSTGQNTTVQDDKKSETQTTTDSANDSNNNGSTAIPGNSDNTGDSVDKTTPGSEPPIGTPSGNKVQ